MIETVGVNVVSTLVSLAVGGYITWQVARLYYVKAAEDLKAEASELQRLTTLVLRALEEGGIAQLNRNATGVITGLVLTGLVAEVRGTSTVTADLTVEPHAQDDDSGTTRRLR